MRLSPQDLDRIDNARLDLLDLGSPMGQAARGLEAGFTRPKSRRDTPTPLRPRPGKRRGPTLDQIEGGLWES